jgi:ADP-heptose:LPS heptosyltransferase
MIYEIKEDCLLFKGDIPCEPHKRFKVHCFDGKGNICKYYKKTNSKILIIKLGALGDVIRTTPIITRLKYIYADAAIYWLTLTPEILPDVEVDVKLNYDFKALVTILATDFDLCLNFDKGLESCALTNLVSAKVKKGFYLNEGKPAPIDKDAQHKFLTGIFDDVSQMNTKHYVEEIMEIAGFGEFRNEPYILDNAEKGKHKWNIDKSKKVVGLNTGCGGRWPSRLWPEKYWQKLAERLLENGCEVILLGGEQEETKNQRIAELSGAKYFGYFPLKVFIDEVYNCEIVVTQVTMTLHIAIALSKKVVLMNNIFNRNEFYLYGMGEIIEPPTECECYYLPNCLREIEGRKHCMKEISVDRIYKSVIRLI